jgi:hypothetical protein
MRCRYREKVYKTGDYLEAEIYPVFHQGGGKSRRKARYKPTSAMQARLNQRRAERELTRLLNENFKDEDYELTLTFTDEYLPEVYENALRMAVNYMRRVKRLYAKYGIKDLKYVIVPGGGRYHFHIVMTGGVSREELEKLWKLGYANSKRLKFAVGGVAGLAHYIANQLKEDEYGGEDLFGGMDIDEETGEVTEERIRKKGARRWSCSKNLVRPEPEVKDGRISQARVEELCTIDANSRSAYEKLYPGYTFESAKGYYNPENGGYYIQIIMKKRKDRGTSYDKQKE